MSALWAASQSLQTAAADGHPLPLRRRGPGSSSTWPPARCPAQQLQSWSGTAWSQAEPGAGPPHRLPPLKRSATTPAAAGSNGGCGSTNGSSGSTNGSSARQRQRRRAPWQPQPGFGASRSVSNGSAGGAGSKAGSSASAAGTSPPAQQKGNTATGSAPKPDGNSSGANGSKAPHAPAVGVSFFEAQARLEAHYCVNGAFLLDRPILEVNPVHSGGFFNSAVIHCLQAL